MDIQHYADGKERSEIDRIKQLEKIYSIDIISPYGTNHTAIFEEKIKKMEIEQLNSLAHKVGAIVSADKEEQRGFLRETFRAYQSKNPPNYSVQSAKKAKLNQRTEDGQKAAEVLDSARTKSVFEKRFPKDNPESFRKLLNSYTLADLQNLSAQCGFNPSFDRKRIVDLLTKEFERDLRLRVK